MSLLEDDFLEDEAGEAQDLERIIEGDGYDDQERNSDDDDDGERREDEAEEDKRRVDPNSTKNKKVVKNPRFVLNPARLTGPRGIHVIPEHFKNFKFKGKGHEKEDLDNMLKKLEHWAYRLYPKFKFEDCLKKMEMLGKKRIVMVHLNKIRSDQYSSEETIIQKDSSDDEAPAVETAPPEDEDEFDKLLQQQITLAHTPAGKRLQVPPGDISTPMSMPKPTSSPSISEEQKQRMLQNRAMAEQRRLAKLTQVHGPTGLGGQVEQESVDLTANDTNSTKDDNNKGNHHKSIDNENGIFEIVDDHSNNMPIETSVDLTVRDTISKSCATELESVVDLTEKTDIAVRSRKRRSKTYETYDDEIEKSDGESINTVNGTSLSVSISTDIDKSVGDKAALSEARTVALTGLKQDKRKANIIDSSDEECNAAAEDISIIVDIHKENTQSQQNNDSTDDLTNKTYEDPFDKQKNIDHIALCNVRSETNENRSEKHKNINKIGTSFNQIDEDIEMNCVNANTGLLSKNQANAPTKSIRIETSNNTHKQNGHSLDNVKNIVEDNFTDENKDQENCENEISGKISVDDVMDVDFSEEF